METPETNKAERMAYAGEYMVPTEIARRLERERDVAKVEAARIDGAYEDATNYYARMIELTEERDEARELARQMSESNQVLMADARFYRNAWKQLKEIAK